MHQIICFELTLLLVPSASPTSLTAMTVSSRAIFLSWNSPPSIHINGIITSYTLTYTGVERDSTLRTLTLPENSNTYQLTGLDEDTEYVISVRASTAVGAGPWAMESNSTFEDSKLDKISNQILKSRHTDT